MSTHKSLRNRKTKNRSVRKKWERLDKLVNAGKFILSHDDILKKHNSIFEFPKEKILRRKKIKKKEEAEKTMEELIKEKDDKETTNPS